MSGFMAFIAVLVALYVHFFYKNPHEKSRQDTTYKKIKENQREEKKLTRFTTKKKVEIVMDIFQGKTTIDEVSRMYDLAPSVIDTWIKEAQQGMENQLNTSVKDLLTQYEE
jgi:transposase-like protein